MSQGSLSLVSSFCGGENFTSSAGFKSFIENSSIFKSDIVQNIQHLEGNLSKKHKAKKSEDIPPYKKSKKK